MVRLNYSTTARARAVHRPRVALPPGSSMTAPLVPRRPVGMPGSRVGPDFAGRRAVVEAIGETAQQSARARAAACLHRERDAT